MASQSNNDKAEDYELRAAATHFEHTMGHGHWTAQALLKARDVDYTGSWYNLEDTSIGHLSSDDSVGWNRTSFCDALITSFDVKHGFSPLLPLDCSGFVRYFPQTPRQQSLMHLQSTTNKIALEQIEIFQSEDEEREIKHRGPKTAAFWTWMLNFAGVLPSDGTLPALGKEFGRIQITV